LDDIEAYNTVKIKAVKRNNKSTSNNITTVKHSDVNSDEENDTNSLKSEKINENDLKSMDNKERKRVC
jgi:hypothetical protein